MKAKKNDFRVDNQIKIIIFCRGWALLYEWNAWIIGLMYNNSNRMCISLSSSLHSLLITNAVGRCVCVCVCAFIFFSDKLKIICMNRYVLLNLYIVCTRGHCACFVWMNERKGHLTHYTTGTKSFEVSARVCTLLVCISKCVAFHYYYTEVWLISIRSTFFSAFICVRVCMLAAMLAIKVRLSD